MRPQVPASEIILIAFEGRFQQFQGFLNSYMHHEIGSDQDGRSPVQVLGVFQLEPKVLVVFPGSSAVQFEALNRQHKSILFTQMRGGKVVIATGGLVGRFVFGLKRHQSRQQKPKFPDFLLQPFAVFGRQMFHLKTSRSNWHRPTLHSLPEHSERSGCLP